jgi:adenylate cyclase, class 2
MSATRRNTELKCRCPDLDRARDAIRAVGARFDRTMLQADTYFRVSHGRLKLREIDDHGAELIWYARPDTPGYRDSQYTVVPAPDPAALKSALTAACGLRGEVRKSRELWLYHNVRIHLDQVEGLGSFVEFEAVIADRETDEPSLARLEQLRVAMDLRAVDRISVSYADMLSL